MTGSRMTAKLPKKLNRAPLLETIFELRFSPARESAGNLLIGLLYSKFPGYENIEPLPIASIPKATRDAEPLLRYAASHQLATEKKRILIGDRVVGLSHMKPYKGWGTFRGEIETLLEALKGTKLAQSIERYSLKYSNILPVPEGDQLRLLNARFEIAGRQLKQQGFQLRTEIQSGDFVTIVEISTNATSQNTEEVMTGLLIHVDSIRQLSTHDLWERPAERLDQLHHIVKGRFFELLTSSAIDELEPVWE